MKTIIKGFTAAAFALASFAACTSDDEAPAEADDAAEITALEISAPDGCEPLAAIARPIAAPHFHDDKLQQTAGKLTLRLGDSGVRVGTSLATIVGVDASGAPLGNHDWLFADGGLRTQNDKLALVPTANPCLFDVSSEIYVVEGSGLYAGYSGTVNGVGRVDFCGGVGKVTITGYLCQ